MVWCVQQTYNAFITQEYLVSLYKTLYSKFIHNLVQQSIYNIGLTSFNVIFQTQQNDGVAKPLILQQIGAHAQIYET